MTHGEFERLFDALKNWGRWGPADQRGTLNYLTPHRTRAAASLLRSGRTVSLSLPINTVAGPDNPKPALHYMTQLADVDPGEPGWIEDFVGMDYHGIAHTHIDALCHCSYRRQLYNGVPIDSVTTAGGSYGAITAIEHGIVGRGILLDLPRLRGVPWLEPGTAVLPAELEAAEAEQRVHLEEGDILFLRSGHHRRRMELGPWPGREGKAGLHPTAMAWLHERRVAASGSDGGGDTVPSPVEGVTYPIHALALTAMGLYLLDNLQFEDLVTACEAEGRWEFLCVVAPLRIPGGTGSPVNPIAIF
jgi:kynurenine formamidase